MNSLSSLKLVIDVLAADSVAATQLLITHRLQ